MNQKTVVAQAISASPAIQAGRLFAQSETDASSALELSARALGDTPSYEAYTAHRVEWVNGYCEVKPQAKGQSADKAFNRFKDRLVDAFAITIPKATSASATKKAEERAKNMRACPTMICTSASLALMNRPRAHRWPQMR